MRDVLYPQETPALQNVAVRLVLGLRKFDHISGAIRGLHRLPVRQRIDYKVALLTYKCHHGLATPYLVRQCELVSDVPGRQCFRSSTTHEMIVQRTKSVRLGSRPFGVSGPTFWNSLPALSCSYITWL